MYCKNYKPLHLRLKNLLLHLVNKFTILTRKIDFKLEVFSFPIKYACLVRMQIEPNKAEEELKNIPDPVY